MKQEDLKNLKIEDLEEVTEGYWVDGEEMIVSGVSTGSRYLETVFFIKSDHDYGIIVDNEDSYSSRVYKAYKIPQPKMRDMNSLEVMEYLWKINKIDCVVCRTNSNNWSVLGFFRMLDRDIKESNFAILKNGKITEFKLPQIEV